MMRPRPRLKRCESQWRDRDRRCLILMPRPRLKNISLNDETETETEKIWVSITRLGKRCRYRDSIETFTDLCFPHQWGGEWSTCHEMNSIFYMPDWLVWSFSQSSQVGQVWLDSFCLVFFWLKMTQQDFDNLWMSRLWLIETGMYVGCRDRDSLRLRNILDVETETHRDWDIS